MDWLFYVDVKSTECLGRMGSSSSVSIFADGDGDFQPKFKSDVEWEKVEPVDKNKSHYDEEDTYVYRRAKIC